MVVLVDSDLKNNIDMVCFNFENSALYLKKAKEDKWELHATVNDSKFILGCYLSKLNAELSLLNIAQAYIDGSKAFKVLNNDAIESEKKGERQKK